MKERMNADPSSRALSLSRRGVRLAPERSHACSARAALAVALGTLTPGPSAVAFAVLLDRYFVAPEEERLLRTFGRATGGAAAA